MIAEFHDQKWRVLMPTCDRCGRRFRTLPDEDGDHQCERCYPVPFGHRLGCAGGNCDCDGDYGTEDGDAVS
jgi:hypothetical protein